MDLFKKDIRQPAVSLGITLIVVGLLLSGCQGASSPNDSSSPALVAGNPLGSEGFEDDSYLVLNQRWIEALSSDPVDLEDVDEVFWHVFSRLPDSVTVYPTENYYYFKLYVDGRQFWGNIRLPAGRRERGVLSFAYFEFRESPFETSSRLQRAKYFTIADGLIMEEVDPFTYSVSYAGKDVVFNFNRISQDPPNLFSLADDEVFVQRTFDESGYQFFLIFNESERYFLWVLNEEELVPDSLEPLQDELARETLLVGKRSGFAFWVDKANGNRKILAAIRGQSATRNDYYDGPFDQLADNYVDVTDVSKYMQLASPSLQGRIDKYGYFTDRESGRVSISPYYVYFSLESLADFVTHAEESEDTSLFISFGARSLTTTLHPTATPTQ